MGKSKNLKKFFGNYRTYLLLGFIVFLVYFNSLFNPFIWDDIHLVVQNPYIKNFLNFPHYFTQDVFRGGSSNFYRPMQTIFYAIVYHIAGVKPWAFHLLNIILHSINTILVFILVKKLYGEKIAFFSSLLFGVHPLNTEAITYISGTADPLFFLFCLLSIIFFLRERYFLSYLFFIISFLSKEIGVITPFYLLVILYGRGEENKKNIKTIIPFFLIIILYVVFRFNFTNVSQKIPISFRNRFLTSFKSYLLYLSLIIFPYKLHMERSLNWVLKFTDIGFLSGFLIFIFSIFLVFKFRKNRKVIFPYLWFLVNFFAVSGIFIQLNANLSEHFIYSGIAGIVIYLPLFLKKFIKKEKVFTFLLCILCLIYGIRSVLRNFDWKNPEKFYEKAISQSSACALHHNLGIECLKKGKYDEAIKEFKKTLALKKYIYSYIGLGRVYFLKGENKKAEEFFKKALQLSPSSAPALFNLSLVYIEEGKIEKGKELLLYCISKNPAFQFAYSLLGEIYMKEKNYKEAMKYLKIAVEINPDDFRSHHKLGICYGFLRKFDKAEEEFKKAVELKPDEISYLRNLAFLLRQENKIDEAIMYYKKALQIKPDSADILNDIGICYAMKGDKKKAIEMWKKAVEINPQLKSAVENLKRIENKK